MQCYTELTPPTAVTHALYLPFLSPSSNNLVVAKTSLLQIFSLKSITTEAGTSGRSYATATDSIHHTSRHELESDSLDQSYLASDIVLQKSERIHTTKLVLVTEYALSGTIVSIARVKTLSSLSGGEALLVASKDAKLSLVEWDPQRHGISTISIHYYEREDLQGSPWTPHLSHCVNYLTVDPSSRCAALKFSARNLAILPFHQAGDDLVMDDYDPDIDGERPGSTVPAHHSSGVAFETQTPYASSFVLPVSALDPSLIHPVHLAFLYEYREPTFGILSSQIAASASLLHERRDMLSYTVFTLDLEQRASTSLLSITGLPYDLHKVIPLPPPVGGALLVGGNELIHVDQAGKTNGVGVNEFAKQSSFFAMADQSDLAMRLEGCTVEHLGADNGDMLMVLNTGELAVLGFRLDGRSVSGISVRRVAEDHGGLVVLGKASCAAVLGRGRLFIGGEDSDSVILGWTRKSDRSKRKRSQAGLKTDDEDAFIDEDDMDDDDDLYSGAAGDSQQELTAIPSKPSADGDYVFRIHDFMSNLAPLSEIALGRPGFLQGGKDARTLGGVSADLELVSISGHGRAGGVTILNREINPKMVGRFDFRDAHGIWAVCAKRSIAKGMMIQSSASNQMNGDCTVEDTFDRFMIVSESTEIGAEESTVYALTATGSEEMKGTEFESAAGGTIDVGTLAGGTRIVQALKGEIRSYDGGKSRSNSQSFVHLVKMQFWPRKLVGLHSVSSMSLFPTQHTLDARAYTAFWQPMEHPCREDQVSSMRLKSKDSPLGNLLLKDGIYYMRAIIWPALSLFKPGSLWCCILHMSDRNNTKRYTSPMLYIIAMCALYRVLLCFSAQQYQRLTSMLLRPWPGPDISYDR